MLNSSKNQSDHANGPRFAVFSKTTVLVLSFALIVSVFFFFRYWWHASRGLSLSTAQYLIFIPVIVLLSLVTFFERRLPRVLLIGSICAGLTSAAFAYSYRDSERGAFLVSRLKGDEYEIQTRQLREYIRGLLQLPNSPTVSRYYRSLDRHSQASVMLKADRELKGVLWGNENWLNISMPEPSTVSLAKLGVDKRAGKLGAIRIVTSVPAIGISIKPIDATGKFLSELFTGLVAPKTGTKPKVVPIDEMALITAASRVAPWTGSAHRSFPLLLLGNHYLAQALRNGNFEAGTLECALRAYRRAKIFSYGSGNPELAAAVENNYGVALLVKSLYTDTPGLEGQAEAMFNTAQGLMSRRNPYDVPYKAGRVATKNDRRLLRGTADKKRGHKFLRKKESGRKHGQ